MSEDKLLGEKRRTAILEWLQNSKAPLTGGALAKKTHVSRQVIVQDISLLKAKNHPIIATARGYLYYQDPAPSAYVQIIACKHAKDATEEELNILVDHGVHVKNVIVEHPVYGELTASLMIETRQDVQSFLHQMSSTQANLLSNLTDGIHLHTIEADRKEKIEEACQALAQASYLISTD